MSKSIDRTPTLGECLTLWKQKGELTTEIEELKLEQVVCGHRWIICDTPSIDYGSVSPISAMICPTSLRLPGLWLIQRKQALGRICPNLEVFFGQSVFIRLVGRNTTKGAGAEARTVQHRRNRSDIGSTICGTTACSCRHINTFRANLYRGGLPFYPPRYFYRIVR